MQIIVRMVARELTIYVSDFTILFSTLFYIFLVYPSTTLH